MPLATRGGKWLGNRRPVRRSATKECAMARHLVLDIRGLEPPEPMERVLTAIADFGQGDTLRILSNFEPTPLYRILERDGFRHHVEAGADAPCEITIWAAE
jgi:TusA-related sulfurtransferase